MKRRNWWMALFAPQVIAQQPKEAQRDSYEDIISRLLEALASQRVIIDSLHRDIHEKPKPLNNQCPVCGKMADPYDSYARVPGQDIKLASRITRCSHCNAAFWQDADETR